MNRAISTWSAWACTGGLLCIACGSGAPTTPANAVSSPPGPTHGTHRLSGTVLDTTGAPLSGVLLRLVGLGTPPVQTTGADGTFAFTGLQYPQVIVDLTKDGYEPAEFYYGPTDNDGTETVQLEQATVIAAGGSADVTLLPDDLAFYTSVTDGLDGIGAYCGPPCKLIRVSVTSPGALSVRTDWQDQSVALGLYIRPYYTVLDLPWTSPPALESQGTPPLTLSAPVDSGTWAVLVGARAMAGPWPLRLHIETTSSPR
jgi:hypothetical protein